MTITAAQRETLEAAACQRRTYAYAPYSGFQVGAAVLAGSGAIYTGVNVENVAFNPTICAERVAIFQAIAAGERQLLAVAVCTETGATPCGPCRQVMREFARDLPVYICDTSGNSRETSLSALLPDSFGPEDLPV
jgi:cytidine deaminase